MATFLAFQQDKRSATYQLGQTTVEEIGSVVAEVFNRRGYKLEQGAPTYGIYGTGSAVARAFLGAFVRRHKFRVQITGEGGMVHLLVMQEMSGWSGGLIGASAQKTETAAVAQLLHQCFTAMHTGAAQQQFPSQQQLPPQQP